MRRFSDRIFPVASIFYFLVGAILLIGCDNGDDDSQGPGNGDGGSSGDSDSDADTDPDAGADDDGGTDTDTGGDTGPNEVIPMDCKDCQGVGDTLSHMLCAIDVCDDELIGDNKYTYLNVMSNQCTLEDTYEAVTRFGDPSNDLEPKLNGSYALMASGPALGTIHSIDCSNMNPLTDTLDGSQTYDNVEWQLVLRSPDNARAFRFKYVFFSEEYDDFISSEFNDKFYVFLEAKSTKNGQKTLINFASCRDPDIYSDFQCQAGDPGCTAGEKYCYIAINSAYSDCCWYPQGSTYAPNPAAPACPNFNPADRTDITGTGFECAAGSGSDMDTKGSSTGWLQTTWPIDGGETFILTFHIHDTNDGIYDSEVIIDAFEFLTKSEHGTAPVK